MNPYAPPAASPLSESPGASFSIIKNPRRWRNPVIWLWIIFMPALAFLGEWAMDHGWIRNSFRPILSGLMSNVVTAPIMLAVIVIMEKLISRKIRNHPLALGGQALFGAYCRVFESKRSNPHGRLFLTPQELTIELLDRRFTSFRSRSYLTLPLAGIAGVKIVRMKSFGFRGNLLLSGPAMEDLHLCVAWPQGVKDLIERLRDDALTSAPHPLLRPGADAI